MRYALLPFQIALNAGWYLRRGLQWLYADMASVAHERATSRDSFEQHPPAQ